jgi:hypothetical protein
MQIRIALIPLITYTPPNDLATHSNVYNYRLFDAYLFYRIFIFYGKIYYNCSKSFFLQVFLISFLVICLGHLNSVYVGGFLNNLEQYANIAHKQRR